MTKLQQNKSEFIKLCKENITNRDISSLLTYCEESDFFIAPCSTKYHLCYKGGLCEHSLNVYKAMLELCTAFNINVATNIETITIISLFHDICKTNYYIEEIKSVKENNQWVQKACYTIKDNCPLGHGEKSVILLSRFIYLSFEEIYAIRWHMGAFDNTVKGGDYAMNEAYSKSDFVTLLQCADMIASKILEK